MNLFKVSLECYESPLLEIMWSVIIQGSIMYNFVPWKLEVRKRPLIGNLVFLKCLSAKRLEVRKRAMYVPRHCKFLLFDRSIKGTNKLDGRSLVDDVNHRS